METRAREELMEVAELYARLAAVTPDNAELYGWHVAHAWYGAGAWTDAELALGAIAAEDVSPNRDAARYYLMLTRREIIVERHGALERLPEGARVEASITRYTLSAEHVAFIASADDLVTTAVDDPQIASLVEVDRAALMYLPAKILDVHGHNAEARQRFERIIERFPEREEATYAAMSIVSTYLEDGDREAAERMVEAYDYLWPQIGLAPHRPHRPSSPAEFRYCDGLAQAGDHEGVVAEYRAFLEAYPKSVYRNEALYNLANSLDILGRAAEARAEWLQFRTEYPEEARAPGLLFRIADSYFETQDFDEAIATYLELHRVYPEHRDALGALYNAAFLQASLHRHADAARGFDAYASGYPAQSDAEAAAWRACGQWAQVSAAAGLSAYQQYLTRYPNEDDDHLIEAWYQIARLHEARGDTRQAAEAWAQVQRVYDAAVEETVSGPARSLAATQPLAALEARMAAFGSGTWTDDDTRNIQRLSKGLPEELRAITEEAHRILGRYRDPDTIAAALYWQGAVYFSYADLVRTFPIPDGTPEETVAYERTLEVEFFFAAEQRGRNRLLAGLERAAESRRWSDWNTRALVLLHERYPWEFPTQRPETWGTSEGWAYAGAVTMAEP